MNWIFISIQLNYWKGWGIDFLIKIFRSLCFPLFGNDNVLIHVVCPMRDPVNVVKLTMKNFLVCKNFSLLVSFIVFQWCLSMGLDCTLRFSQSAVFPSVFGNYLQWPYMGIRVTHASFKLTEMASPLPEPFEGCWKSSWWICSSLEPVLNAHS